MKAEFTYSNEEVQAMVLAEHNKNHVTPKGMKWEAVDYYGSVKVEAVKIELPVVEENVCQ